MSSIFKDKLYGIGLVMTLTAVVFASSSTRAQDAVTEVGTVNDTIKQDLMTQGQQQMEATNFVDAVDTFARAAALFPGNADVYDALQMAKLKAKEQGGMRSLDRIEDTIARLDALDAFKVEELRTAVAAEEKAREEAEAYAQKLNTELQHYSDRNNALMTSVEDMEMRIDQLQSEREALASQTTDLSATAEERTILVESMNTEIDSLKSALADAEAQASKAREELKAMELERKEALTHATRMGATNNNVLAVPDKRREQELQTELERTQRVREQLERDSTVETTENAQAEFRLQNLLREHTEAVDEIQHLKSKINELEESVEATER